MQSQDKLYSFLGDRVGGFLFGFSQLCDEGAAGRFSVSPHGCFILVLILISVFLR